MKKITLIGVLALTMALLAGCGGNASRTEDKIQIVCTTFPQYDWTRELLGDLQDQVELTLLLDNGVDMHSYQPTASDMAKIGSADLVLYIGGESEGWVEDALAEALNPEIKSVNLMETLGDAVKEEEIVEGMEEEEHDHEDHEDEEETEYDEHVWLSLKNAATLVNTIADALTEVAPLMAEEISANSRTYLAEIESLDQEYAEMAENATYQTVLFGDRFPFRYLMDDYNITYYAAFPGCSAETEASFGTITFLAQKLDELKLPAILIMENADGRVAQTIQQSTEGKTQEILTLNSLQAVTKEDMDAGTTYLSVMQQNLEILRQAME